MKLLRNLKTKHVAWNCSIVNNFDEKLYQYNLLRPIIKELYEKIYEVGSINIPDYKTNITEISIYWDNSIITIENTSPSYSITFSENEIISYVSSKRNIKCSRTTFYNYIKAIIKYIDEVLNKSCAIHNIKLS